MSAAAADFLINAQASGVYKVAGIVNPTGLAASWAAAFSWALFLALGPASVAYFKPLTRRSAFSVALGLTAVFSILTPPV